MAIATLLDLTIRARTDNARSLDDVVRSLKRRSYDQPRASYYLRGRGYTESDVERAASEVLGADLRDWFARHVGGTDELPWEETLALAGLRVRVVADGPARRYEVEEIPDAKPAQVAVRQRWLTGNTRRRVR
jgi:predicted metalloprotease with PDZ domain